MRHPPLTCLETRRLLHDRLDGAVDIGTERSLLLHLRSCDPCRTEDGHLRRLDGLLAGMTVPAPTEGFTEGVVGALDRAPSVREPEVPARARARFAAILAGGAVTGLSVVLVGGSFLGSAPAEAAAALLPLPADTASLAALLVPPPVGDAVGVVRAAVSPALAAAASALVAGGLAAQAAMERRRAALR